MELIREVQIKLFQSVPSNKSSTAVWNRFNIITKQGIDFTPCSFDFGTLIGELKIAAWL